MAEARRLQHRRDVLRRHLHRSGQRRPRVHRGYDLPGLRRRWEEHARAGSARDARGQSHHLGGSGEHGSPAGRQRRRALSFVRPRRHVDVLRESPAAAVLRRGRGQRRAVLQRLRWPAGQQLARRTVAHAIGSRHPEPGLVRHAGRRRLHDARRSRGSQHHLRRAAARRHRARQQGDRRAYRHPAAGGEGWYARTVELGFTLHHLAAFAHDAVPRVAASLSIRRPRQLVEDRLARSHAADRSQHAAGHGPGLGPRCGRKERLDGALRQYLGDCREPEESRPAVRRLGRRPDPRDR